jgi:hypothetical protein
MNIADLVEQYSTTTGTGAYTLGAMVPWSRSFATAFGADKTAIPCVVVDQAGNYEVGFYDYTHSGTTLARTKIIASSNANAAVNWAAGTRRIRIAPFAATSDIVGRLNNFAAVALPTINDDSGDGYSIGSWWLYSGFLFICINATVGAAAWLHLPAGTDHGDTGVRFLAPGGIRLGAINAQYGKSGVNISAGFNAADVSGSYSYSDAYAVAVRARTADATPRKMATQDDFATYSETLYIDNNSIHAFEAIVTAVTLAGDAKSWKVQVMAITDGAGTVTLTVNSATAIGAAGTTVGWAVTAVSPAVNQIALQVTGAAATEINWAAIVYGATGGRY